MYFDIKPKTSKKDLYDREEELSKLMNLDAPMAMVLGQRRLGKTSLLRVFSNEIKTTVIYVYARVFPSMGTSLKKFYKVFFGSMKHISKRYEALSDVFSKIQGIQIFGMKIDLKNDQNLPSVIDVFNTFDMYGREKEEKTHYHIR